MENIKMHSIISSLLDEVKQSTTGESLTKCFQSVKEKFITCTSGYKQTLKTNNTNEKSANLFQKHVSELNLLRKMQFF